MRRLFAITTGLLVIALTVFGYSQMPFGLATRDGSL